MDSVRATTPVACRRLVMAVLMVPALLASGLAGCGGSGGGDTRAARASVAPAVAVKPTEAAWATITSEEGRFSVEMPGHPQAQEQSRGDIRVKFFILAEGKKAAYTLSYYDFPRRPANGAQATLAGALDGVTREAREVGTRKKIVVQGHPGLESEFTPDQGGHMWYRVVLVGNRLYQQGLVAHDSVKPDYAQRVPRFFESFRVVGR